MDSTDRWRTYVDGLPWCKGQLDPSSHVAFLRASTLGVDRQTAFEAVAERIVAAGDRVRPRKLAGQIERAYRYAGSSPIGDIAHGADYRPNPWPTRDPDLIASIAASGFGLADLAESSPIRFDDDQPHTEEIIDALFPGNPLLCAARTHKSFWTSPRESFRGELAGLRSIVPNPMIALEGRTTEADRHLSAHSLENTGTRRFLVIEFDHGPQDEQAALIDYLAQRGPLALVVYSGSRSLHAWFPCSGESESTLGRFMRCAARLGADLSGWRNRSQFVRMPDGTRPDGHRQPVHYFNPEVLR
jgi:hypothetical protein